MNEVKITSTDIKKALANLHCKDFFITECKNGSTYFPPSQGLLKFDGLAITKSYTQPCITGYEIKVSRGDFLQDDKWHLYLQYCNKFYFVVPAGLIKKEELPDDVGLIYYYPESGTLRSKKKALYRDIEEPVGIYKYIIYSRLDQDRLPFYESKADYAADYIADKAYKKIIGKTFGTKITKELQEANERLEKLKRVEESTKLLEQIRNVMYEHGIAKRTYKQEDVVKELDEALRSKCPKEVDEVRISLESAIRKLNSMGGRENG